MNKQQINPIAKNIQSLLQSATEHHQANRFNEAEIDYLEILQHNPTQVDALHLLGVVYYQRREYPKAIERITQASMLAPKAAIIHYNLGLSYLEYGDLKLANQALLRAKKFDPQHYLTDFALAKVELNRGHYEKAWQHLQAVLKKANDWGPALELKALVLEKRHQWSEAMSSYESLLSKQPHQCNVLNNYAKMLLDLNELTKAKTLLDTLLQIEPNFPSGLINLGLWHLKKNQYLEAIHLYHQFLEVHPNNPLALSNLALAYRRHHQHENAIIYTNKLLEHPNENHSVIILKKKALVGLCLSLQATCQWDAFKRCQDSLISKLTHHQGPPLMTPFEGIMLNLKPHLLEKVRQQYIDALITTDKRSLPRPLPRSRFRIGYLSPDLGDHPIGLLLQYVLQYHNKNQFEIYGLSLNSHQDPIQQYLKNSVEHWLELGHLSHQEILQQIRHLEFDLIIDLAGFTMHARPELLKSRLAYRQAHWLGYPGTLGHQCVDYLITSRALTIDKNSFHESLCVLPAWFTTRIELNMPLLSRQMFGLPEDQFIFCCLQRHYRIDEAVMTAWIDILKQVPDSCLWLLSGGASTDARLRTFISKQGINDARLIFADNEKLSLRFYHRLADLWLDTWHISSGTSAVLALACQLPVLSLKGHTPQAKTSSAILTMLNAQELICENANQYINTAIELVKNPSYLRKVKNKLAEHHQQSLLFNPQSFMPIFEQAIVKMIMQDKPTYIEL